MTHVLNRLMYFLRRGERRRRNIVRVLAQHPDREYLEREICLLLGVPAGALHHDLWILYQRGRIGRRTDSGVSFCFRIAPTQEETTR